MNENFSYRWFENGKKNGFKNFRRYFKFWVWSFEATNGQEAVDLYKTHKPNLVLMDLTMPVMDGFEALKRIKELESDANVVVISADIQKQAIDKALKLGAFNFIKTYWFFKNETNFK